MDLLPGTVKGKMGNMLANDLRHNRLPTWQWKMSEEENSVTGEWG